MQAQFPEPKRKRQMRCNLLIANSSTEAVETVDTCAILAGQLSLLSESLGCETPLFKKQTRQDLKNDTEI